jgi:serine protease
MSGFRNSVVAAAALAVTGASLYVWAQTQAPSTNIRSSAQAQRRAELLGSQQRLNRLIIKFKDSSASNSKSSALGVAGSRDRVQALNTFSVTGKEGAATLSYLKSVSGSTHVARTSQPLTHADLSALARTVAQDPRVEYAEVDEKVYAHFLPNDPLYGAHQGYLQSPYAVAGGANLPNAWGRRLGGVPVSGAGVTVAVLDTGYQPHADLAANIVGGYDFIGEDGFDNFATANDGDGRDADARDPGDWNTQSNQCDVENSSWHGTHVAGIIGAVGNNNTGVVGVAYRAKILPLRVLGVCGGYTSDTTAAMQWAAGLSVPGVPDNPNPAKVLNMSFGRSGNCSQTYQAAVTAARNAGTTIVVSTGNESSTTGITQPANCQGVIAVTSHTALGAKADYANTGPGTSISALGDNIYSTSNTGITVPATDSYDSKSGTSFSAPQVAGIAALLVQLKPGISPAEVQTTIMQSARPYAAGTLCATRTDCGAGLLDAFKAVHTLLQAQGIANAAPVMTPLPTQYVLPGGTLQFTAAATDADGDESVFIGTGLPAGASFDPVTGIFNWPKATPAGDYTFVIQPTDGAVLGASMSVKISVTTAIPVVPVVPVTPVTPATPPLTVTPIVAPSGGGGALGWLDAAAGLMLLAGAAWVRRAAPAQPVGQQHRD